VKKALGIWLLTIHLWGVEGFNGKSTLIILPFPSGTMVLEDRNISVLRHPTRKDQGIAILPIDYEAPLGETSLLWVSPTGTVPMELVVKQGAYPTEVLTVEPSKVTPPPEALERIAREKAQAEAIFAHFTPMRYWDKPFIRPLESVVTSVYGAARVYNGTLKNYHSGVDLRARTPIPVLAANEGVVVLAQERYYCGNTLIIDHGEGIYTSYLHLSRFDVHVGDRVVRGQPIALSGATGRVNAPHLHFGMTVQGVKSDPLDLITHINALFTKEPQ